MSPSLWMYMYIRYSHVPKAEKAVSEKPTTNKCLTHSQTTKTILQTKRKRVIDEKAGLKLPKSPIGTIGDDRKAGLKLTKSPILVMTMEKPV